MMVHLQQPDRSPSIAAGKVKSLLCGQTVIKIKTSLYHRFENLRKSVSQVFEFQEFILGFECNFRFKYLIILIVWGFFVMWHA